MGDCFTSMRRSPGGYSVGLETVEKSKANDGSLGMAE